MIVSHTHSLPMSTPARRHRRMPMNSLSVSNRILRILVAGIALAAAAMLVVFNFEVRSVEAILAAITLDPFVPDGSFASRESFLVWIEPEHLVAFQVTIECTVLIILVPLLLVWAAMLAFSSLKWWRAFVALAVTLIAVAAVNILRLAFIGWASYTWGMDFGFPLAHTFIGSLIGLIGFAGGLAALILIMGGRFRKSRP